MGLNKIQLKARVLELIEPLKKLGAIDDIIVNKIIFELKQIKDADFEFISKVLIKETDPYNQKISTAFLYFAHYLSPESFLGLVMSELNSSRVSDAKKMFLINALSGFGIQMDLEYINSLLLNPAKAIDIEASKFLENAKTDPEALIDFLDFYLVSSDEDKKDLVNSIINSIISEPDFDRVSYALSLLALTVDDEDEILYYLDILSEKKSLHSIKALKYLSYCANQKIAKKASRILRKMSMQGFYTEEKLIEFHKKILNKYEPPLVTITPPDGNSNFSVAISRKTNTGAYSIFFAALNLDLGPFCSFGFSSVTKFDYETITKRFFYNSEEVVIPAEFAKKILTELLIKRIKKNKIIPYEYFCWENLLDDVEPSKLSFKEILLKDLNIRKMGRLEDIIIYDTYFVDGWFFKASKVNSAFSLMMEDILKLSFDNLSDMEDILEKYSKNPEISDTLRTRVMFFAFCLKQVKADEFADMFYSLLYNEEAMSSFIQYILRKSVYEYMLNLKFPKKKAGGLFKKEKTENKCDWKMFIKYIEKNWVE